MPSPSTQKSLAGPTLPTPTIASLVTPQRGSISTLYFSTQIVLLWLLTAAYSHASQLSLSPVFGGYPVKKYHDLILNTFFCLGATFSIFDLGHFGFIKTIIPALSFWIPPIQAWLSRRSTHLGPVLGPFLIEALTIGPLTLLVSYYVVGRVRKARMVSRDGVFRFLTPVVSFLIFLAAHRTIPELMILALSSSPYLTRTSLELALASGYMLLLPSILSLLLAIPAIIHTVGFNPHFVSALTTARLNLKLSKHGYALLDRKESVTGYISVVESLNNFRALRCDHSLLGGEFAVTAERAKLGMVEPETIYAVFTMLESVRLVENPNKRRDEEASALIIGLGIGTSPTALIKLGINTTIVEIDPVVHEFATNYFGLPKNHTAILEDAVGFVAQQSSDPSSHKYDYIIHDVFTGGIEPTVLFTYEFLRGLHSLLSDTGVIAINYASEIKSPSTRLVMNTIFTVFSSCRVYRETSPDVPSTETFANMVIFCTKQGDSPISFRKAEPADWGQSLSRRQFIPPKPEWEIVFDDLKGSEVEDDALLRVDNQHKINQHAINLTTSHWHIMRRVMPDAVWELW